ncbi:MAG: hypothetical protein H7Z41_11260 [Cytophagales bacterium]|nr:hypothetical protein [Armatimonadota bacterium]
MPLSEDNYWLPQETPLERPLCVALVICDVVVEDKRSGNKTLVGLFNSIVAPQIPAVHPRMFLMASLTSGRGTWSFIFRITAPSGREIFKMQDRTRFTDPLAVHDVIVELRNLPLEETGVHFVDLLLNDSPIANRRFTVHVETALPATEPPA